jgi:glucodextranase-like protein/PASTA domain-containing protein
MRTLTAAFAAGLVLLAGCGDDPATRAGVRLTIDEPADLATLREDAVRLRGRVSPEGASVLVRGEPVPVSGGAFETSVPLEPGVNVIDVMASADRARPAMRAVRVGRQVTVEIPDLRGFSPSDATDRLEAIGLKADVDEAGDILDPLLPGEPFVCETDPAAGATVDPGATVRVIAAERC